MLYAFVKQYVLLRIVVICVMSRGIAVRNVVE